MQAGQRRRAGPRDKLCRAAAIGRQLRRLHLLEWRVDPEPRARGLLQPGWPRR